MPLQLQARHGAVLFYFWVFPDGAAHIARHSVQVRMVVASYPQLLRVLALMRLNRRVPVGTHGGVKGRLFS